MRNWRELSEKDIDKLKELYPTTTNRELSKMFDISIDAIQDRFAYPNGWKKDNYKIGNRKGVQLDEKSINWIIKHFKHTPNNTIMNKFNIGESTLHRIAKKYGLKKTKQYLHKSCQTNSKKAIEICRRYNVYEACAEFSRQRWEKWKAEGRQVGFKKGESNRERLSPSAYKKMLEKMSTTRREIIRKDKIRINWGLPQKTKLKLTSPGRKAIVYRHLLKKLNYIVQRGDMRVYYDEHTNRKLTTERRAIINGLKIEKYEQSNQFNRESPT